MNTPCCAVNAYHGEGHSTSCRQWQPLLCEVESCRRPITRWSMWRNRHHTYARRWCGSCAREWRQVWSAWAGGR